MEESKVGPQIESWTSMVGTTIGEAGSTKRMMDISDPLIAEWFGENLELRQKSNGFTILHHLLSEEPLDARMIKRLVTSQAYVAGGRYERDDEGNTPLMMAIRVECGDVTRFMLDRERLLRSEEDLFALVVKTVYTSELDDPERAKHMCDQMLKEQGTTITRYLETTPVDRHIEVFLKDLGYEFRDVSKEERENRPSADANAYIGYSALKNGTLFKSVAGAYGNWWKIVKR